jgi:serine/threonine protein kinase
VARASSTECAQVVIKILKTILDDNCIYVMKEIVFSDSKTLQDALQESKIMARVTHRNICRYRDTIVQKNKLFIVMEYCDKGDLG